MKILFSILSFLFCSNLHAALKNPQAVGFLEKEGVRNVFEHKDGTWHSTFVQVDTLEQLEKAAPRYASPSEWTLFFDGKTQGKITTKPFDKYKFYKDNGLQKVVSKVPKLSFKKTGKKFYDWNGNDIRPVLVSNLDQVTDPDQWTPQFITKVHPAILKDFKNRTKGKVYFCKNENCEGEPSTKDLKDSEITLSSGYKDSKGNELHSVDFKFLPKTHAYCETQGDLCKGEGPFWYLMSQGGEPRFLTKAATLIDAADLNQDGHAELLFWLNEYNSNGYEIIDGKTRTSQRFTWGYH